MPKIEDDRLQRETKNPLDAGRDTGKFIPKDGEYPRIVSHVVQTNAKEGKAPGTSDVKFREHYDEQHGTEENLHNQFVKPNFIEAESTQKFR